MPSAFAAAELKQALSEVPWGMRSYQLLPDDSSTPGAARADIDLLEEGRGVTVACTEGGWAITGSRGRCCKVSSLHPPPRQAPVPLNPLLFPHPLSPRQPAHASPPLTARPQL